VDSTQQKLIVARNIWSEVLGIQDGSIDPDRSYASSGGDSLKSMLIYARLAERGYAVALNDRCKCSTLRELASVMVEAPTLVTELHSITAPLPHVGGKAGGFAALNRLKLPFPPGFVISTEAFRGFVEEVRARTVSARGDAPRTLTLDPSRMLDVPLPSAISDTLSRRLANATGRFAVRSSCSHEDSEIATRAATALAPCPTPKTAASLSRISRWR
jgi:aryl carrier-like protein